MLRILPGLALLLCAGTASAQDTTGTGALRGRVRDADGAVIEKVRVCVLDTPLCTITDGDGEFRFAGLRAATYRLELLPPGSVPFTSETVAVRAGLESAVDITVPRRDVESVVVTAPAFAVPDEVKNSGVLIDPQLILKSAAALQDVSRYVQALPGAVLGTDDFRNDIIVRGGSPLENLFIVDNVEIPNINSFATFASAGGTTSLLDAALLRDVTFLTGGFPAAYANRTSGVLQVTQREGSRERLAARATLGFAGAGGIAEGPIGRRGSWIASFRRSFLDLFTDDIGVGGVPVLYTVNAKALYDVSDRDRLWVVNVSGWDRIRLGFTGDTEDELSTLDIRYRGRRAATGFNWQRVFGTSAVGLLGLSHSSATTSQRVRDLVRDGAPAGAVDDDLIDASPTVYEETGSERETTVKYDLTASAKAVEKLQVGGSVRVSQLDYVAASPFGNDTPYSPQPGVSPFAVDERFSAVQSGAYAQATVRVGARVNVTAGARIDHYGLLDATRVSPRGSVSIRLSNAWSWNTSAGVYYQQPPFLFLATFAENRALSPWRADHYVTGVRWTPTPGVRATIEVYRKNYRDYPVATNLPAVTLANIGDTFDIREIQFPLVSRGRGRATGVEASIERRFEGGLYGTAAVAWSRSRHAALDGVLRPSAFDYPIVVSLSGGTRLGRVWEVSTRLTALSGRPYTPFDTALSVSQRRGVYDLTQVNAARVPPYFRWDARVDRTFTIAGRPFVLFVGAQNVTNRMNVGGYTWNRRANAAEVREQQGVFPNIGFEWRF